ncbi:MAG TPA: DUF3185 family protein [Deltaproteobacteria bacterium]|nr:DUF3185 family protein [Deltaproteobacteria bacterium]
MAKKSINKIGLVLLVAGIGLLVWGINLYGAFGNKLARTLTGASTNETMLFLIAGAICTVLGAVILYKK